MSLIVNKIGIENPLILIHNYINGLALLPYLAIGVGSKDFALSAAKDGTPQCIGTGFVDEIVA